MANNNTKNPNDPAPLPTDPTLGAGWGSPQQLPTSIGPTTAKSSSSVTGDNEKSKRKA